MKTVYRPRHRVSIRTPFRFRWIGTEGVPGVAGDYTYVICPQSIVDADLVAQAIETAVATVRISTHFTPQAILKFDGSVPPELNPYPQYTLSEIRVELEDDEWNPI